jgi:hypothetical protein
MPRESSKFTRPNKPERPSSSNKTENMIGLQWSIIDALRYGMSGSDRPRFLVTLPERLSFLAGKTQKQADL